MTYDAVLAARHGLGADELRRVDPEFMAAVRWAVFVEHGYRSVPDLTTAAYMERPAGARGQALTDFWAAKKAATEQLGAMRKVLMLDEPETPDV